MSAPVGVDISKQKFDAAAWLDGKYKTKTFANTPPAFEVFLGWVRQFEGPHVCLEATNIYCEAQSYALADGEIGVSVVNPAVIAAFADTELSRSKTDKGDAKRIARYCALQRRSDVERHDLLRPRSSPLGHPDLGPAIQCLRGRTTYLMVAVCVPAVLRTQFVQAS